MKKRVFYILFSTLFLISIGSMQVLAQQATEEPTQEAAALELDTLVCVQDYDLSFRYPSAWTLFDRGDSFYGLGSNARVLVQIDEDNANVNELSANPGEALLTVYFVDPDLMGTRDPVSILTDITGQPLPGTSFGEIQAATINDLPAASVPIIPDNQAYDAVAVLVPRDEALVQIVTLSSFGEYDAAVPTFDAIIASIGPLDAECPEPTTTPTATATQPNTEPPVITSEPQDGPSSSLETSTPSTGSTTSMAYGDTVNGVLSAGAHDLYTFNGSQGDPITISLNSTVFDPVLELQNADGNSVGYNDDFDGLNSQISLELPADGVYTIVARSFGTTGEGEYTLSLSEGAAPATPAPSATPSGSADVLRQWASGASATSEYGADAWSAAQAIGAPDTADCGDQSTAWASSSSTGQDTLTVTFAQPVRPQQVNIYETYTPGSITRIELLPANGGAPVVVNTGRDRTECPGVFSIDVSGTDVGAVYGVNIVLDQTIMGSWNEIDAVELVGIPDGSVIAVTQRPPSTLTPTPTATPFAASTPSAIAYGDTISATLSIGTPDEYTFEGIAGDSIRITMNGDFDTYLELWQSSGNEVAYNDDANGLNSEIEIVLPDSDTYRIVARSFASASGGDYTLSLTLTNGGTNDTKGSDNSSGDNNIAYGDTVNGTLNGAPAEYTFTGSAGDFVVITLDSNDFDPYLVLNNSDGQEITHNDDFTRLNSQITTTLTYSGTYTIVARGFSSTPSGAFILTLSGGDAEAMGMGGSIEYGQTVEGTLAGTPQVYSFNGSAGDTVTIALNSPDFDTYLALSSPNGVELTHNDDFNGLNSQISAILPSDGTYAITVRGFSSSASGAFSLSLAHEIPEK